MNEAVDESASSSPGGIVPETTTTPKPLRSVGDVTSDVKLLQSSLETDRAAKLQSTFSPAISRLQFVSLVGRDDEIAILHGCLQRIMTQPLQKQVVLVSGESGTGKSSLVRGALQEPIRRLRGSFVVGKYERKRRPFSAIGQACGELCDQVLLRRNPQLHSLVRSDLKDTIDEPLLQLLRTIIPRLDILLSEDYIPPEPKNEKKSWSSGHGMLGDSAGTTEATKISTVAKFVQRASRHHITVDSSESCSSQVSSVKNKIDPVYSKNLLQFAVRTLLRIMTHRLGGGPVVMLLDDLQWVESSSSVEMLHAIVEDPTIANLFVVGCYRSNEVTETHQLSAAIQKFRDGSSLEENTGDFRLTDIAIGNLSFHSVKEVIMELLSVTDEQKADRLASICYQRTLGNAFFVQVFMFALHEMRLLEFNVLTCTWSWDESKVEVETAATDNVVSLITYKMNKFPPGMLLLLQVASCLGSTFGKSTLALVWNQVGRGESWASETQVEDVLGMAIREMYVESIGESSYRFVHDKIQESAMSLIPEADFDAFRNAIGTVLHQHLDDEDLERNIFVVVDLLNNGLNSGIEIAALNARAAEKAKELSAFSNAVQYVKLGIMSLNGIDAWSECPSLALQLYSVGAEAAECSAGDSEKADWYIKQVIRQNKVETLDKMRVNKIMVERLYRDGEYDKLWTASMDILDHFGCILPRKRAIQRIKAVVYLQNAKRKLLPAIGKIDEMPLIKDRSKREALAFMIKAASFCLGSNNRPLYIILCCECVRWTNAYGLTEYTASSLASFANVLMHENGDWTTAVRVAELALTVERRLGSNYTKSSTLHKTNSFVIGWVKPLRTCRGDYLDSYKFGMLSGNLEAVGMAILFFLSSQFLSSENGLQGLERDLRNYIPQLERYKLHTFVLGMRLLWQKVLNLMGAPYNPQTTNLTGTAMHGIDIERHPFIFNAVGRYHMCNLCAYFGEYEKGADIALAMGDSFYKTWSGSSYFGFEPFPRALCLYAMVLKTSQSTFLTAARKARSSIAKWVKAGAVNLVHQLLILDAEDAAVKGNLKQAQEVYLKAIIASVRGGFLHDAGLANERYALYLDQHNQKTDASHHMKQAIRYYAEWGASRKVKMLNETHPSLLTGSEKMS